MNKENFKYTNSLIDETSPYLLQHAHNPVDWMPWGEEAFEKAKKEDKLVLVSIGYSSCHWCHVMEHESFENEEVAALMNENYVCIKVDREERPDVDQVYMTAVQLMTGSGGWPLNCFTLPDGRPIYGGTYFTKDSWMQILQNLTYTYANDRNKVLEYAEALTQGIQESELIESPAEINEFSTETLDEMVVNWKRGFDPVKGGPNKAPKFPLPNNYEFLMQYGWHKKDTSVLNHVDLTLEQMAMGGIYDQIGGGFARYSTDKDWKVPHFEKMLYDNGQLVSLYANAYQRTNNIVYRRIVYQTLEWVYREMTTDYGSFYSALDADSEGEEGKFYVWTHEELKSVLNDEEFKLLEGYYDLSDNAKWEGNLILLRSKSPNEFAFDMALTMDEFYQKIDAIHDKLLAERDRRVRPGLDDKSLTSWNAIMLNGFIDAYKVFNDERFLKAALMNAQWIDKYQLNKDGSLYHSFKNGQSSIDGFLEDYSFTMSAFINLYEVTFDEQWLEKAEKMGDYVFANFKDDKSGMFFFTSAQGESLISRKMEINDNVMPSSNSELANAFYKLGLLSANEKYVSAAKQMLANVAEDMHTYGPGYSNWGLLHLKFSETYYEVAITGDNWNEKRIEFNKHYIPNKLMMGGTEGKLPLLEGKFVGETTIFVCLYGACQMPVSQVSDAIKQMDLP